MNLFVCLFAFCLFECLGYSQTKKTMNTENISGMFIIVIQFVCLDQSHVRPCNLRKRVGFPVTKGFGSQFVSGKTSRFKSSKSNIAPYKNIM